MKKNIKNIFRYIRPGRRGVVAGAIGLMLGLAAIIIFLKTSGHKAEASAWMNDSWLYRTAYTITNSGSAINAERKVKFDIDSATLITAGKLQSDCDDARFTDASGKQLAYFIDTATGACNTSSTDFYVKVPAVLAGKQTIYFYYGNSTAVQGRQTDFFALDSLGTSLKGYYKLDESAANTCTGGTNDSCDSALNNDGAWNGNAASATGKIGNGIVLDGTDDYVQISGLMGSPSTVTISGWAKFTATDTNGSEIATLGDYVILRMESNGSLSGHYYNGSSWSTVREIVDYRDGNWHHFAYVVNPGSNTQKLYADGVEVDADVQSAAIVYSTQGTNTFIGKHGNGGSTYDFTGTLDDIRIYSRALSGSEIVSMYNAGNATAISAPLTFTQSATATGSEEKGQGPAAYWSFDEGTGTTAQDSTAGNNDGTLTNGPVWKNESDCISGKCLYFDGTNDYVDGGSPSAIDNLSASTVSLWVKPTTYSHQLVNYIISKYTGSAGWAFGINGTYTASEVCGSSSAGKIYVYNGTSSICSSQALNTNQWYHISFTYTSNTVILFINGVQVGSGSLTLGDDSSANLSIGRRSDNNWYYKGFIDEVKIYPYARTAAQIQQDYAARSSVKGVEAQVGSNTATQQLSNGLVAYYPMDEASANSCTGGTNDTCDRSGNGNDGAWNGDAASGAGKYGNGVTLDGTNDYIQIADNATLDITNDLTVATWFKMTSNPTSGNQGLVAKYQSQSGITANQRSYNLYINSSGQVGTVISNNGTYNDNVTSDEITTSQDFADGTWHQAVMVYDADNSLTIYIDGVKNISETDVISSIYNSTAPLWLGLQLDTTVPYLYNNGSLDEVRIYNRALSSSEVRALYNYAPGPVAHWKLDDKSGTSATDTSGNGNTGTLTNSPAWTAGKYGSAVRFDGSDDYITAADSSSLDVTRSASWAFWFNLASLPSGADGKFIDKWIGTGNQRSYQIYPTTTNKISVDISSDGTSGAAVTLNSSDTISANTWTHASVTYDGATVRMYINGNLQSSTAAISGIFNSTANMSIGGDNLGSTNFANGRMDDVRIYNYALSSKQIMNIMAGGEVTDTAVAPVSAARGGPVLSMNFDEGYGTTARDASSQGNSGTLTNMASPATATSGWSNSGKYGKALAFDGTNDYVTKNTYSQSLDITTLSISTWINPSVSPSSGNYGYIFTRGDPTHTSNSDKQYELSMSSSNAIRFRSNGVSLFEAGNISLNQWSHILVTYDLSSTSAKLYINGKLITSGSGSVSNDADAGFTIGSNVAANNFFSGFIDEVKIYPYALTEDEVRLEYNRGSALVFGAKSTAADGTTADNSAGREYCVPGDTATCNAPVAEWKLDEGTGTSAQDTSGGGNTGTLTSGPVWTKGKLGKALKFDGSDDYVTVPHTTSLTLTNFTVSTWFKWESEHPTDVYRSIISKPNNDGSGFTDNFLIYVLDSDHTVGARVGSGGALTTFSSGVDVSDGKWHYVTLTYNSTLGIGNIYVDGISRDPKTSLPTAYTTSSPLLIGEWHQSNPGYGDWSGLIDNVRIYNYARTPAQIAWEYNKGAPVAHYRLDECQGTTAYNSAPTASGDAPGNNGTISIGAGGTNTSAGACTGSAGEAWKDGASGKLGASLEFDGSDDYVTMGDVNSLDFNSTQSFSTSAWFKTSSNGGYYTIVGKKTAPNSTANGWAIYQRVTNSIIGFRTADGTDVIATETTGTYNDNSWHHVIGIIDRTTQMQHLYIDGILVRSSSASSLDDLSNGANLMIGASTSSTNLWNGQIDDVRIYNYALTPVQVRSLYNDGAVSFK